MIIYSSFSKLRRNCRLVTSSFLTAYMLPIRGKADQRRADAGAAETVRRLRLWGMIVFL